MNLAHYLAILHRAEVNLGDAFRDVGDHHQEEPDVHRACQRFAEQCAHHARLLQPAADRYGEDAADEPDRLHSEIFKGAREGALGLLRDLQDLYLMAAEADITWTIVGQAAHGARDDALSATVSECDTETSVQLAWLRTRMKSAAPQALVVARP